MPGTSNNPPAADDSIVMEGTGTVTVPDQSAPVNDMWTVRMAIVLIGLVVLTVLIGELILVLNGKTFPAEVLLLGGVGLGALGSFFVQSSSKRT